MNIKYLIAVLFILSLTAAIATHHIPIWVSLPYGVMSIITAISYYKDKSASVKGGWRIPEKTLHLFSLLGGWPGAIFAQEVFRHKTKKLKFKIIFWLTVVANILLLSSLVIAYLKWPEMYSF